MKHLLSIEDLSRSDLVRLLDLTDHMVEIGERAIPKVPALRGRTVVSLFFEDSTRTRTSFDTAAKRLSADTMNFAVSSSSVNKGESLRDTIETISAMGVDAFVVRHKSSGVPQLITQWTDASIVNAGDGWHQHPTQALLDCYTIRQHVGGSQVGTSGFQGLRIAIVGDIKHSRVARSDVQAFTALGALVTLVAPPTLLPPALDTWPVDVSHDLDAVIDQVDVLYLLRVQRERMDDALLPSMHEYSTMYGLDHRRAARLRPDALVMHPGPMNRGVEMVVDPAELPGSRILQQVTNGVAVRMSVLFTVLGTGSDLKGEPS
jgi:aspartate carbamoyltransferase catalytic subunit